MYPGIIKKLDEVVVNRIAAGEIIQRPGNALKEMIENCLDAKSTYIQISVKSGGLKFLQIQDNGTGIRKDDLEIVCQRFTTSKLEQFEDLSSISTFGFRGEALASISHVAHLTIQTKTSQEKCAYKASYEDGKLKAPPKPCAGNQGTIITVEDLFYNMTQRKLALKSPSEEFQKISDVVSKYAVHNATVGFTLKKLGETPAIRTPPNSTQENNIKIIYGAQISKELMSVELDNSVYRCQMRGFITKVNYSAKKGIMLLFINHRLVDSATLKAAIDSVYSTYLPKGNHPFIYMSLQLDAATLDVNVHPTKHEVHFLYQDEIIESIKNHLETTLLGSNSTRTFYKQLKLPGASDVSDEKNLTLTNEKGDRIYAKDLVRTDSKEQKLEKFLMKSPNKSKIHNDSNVSIGAESSATLKEVKLTSILKMRKQIEKECSTELKKTFREMVFVGVIDQKFAMFQFETKLYLCDTVKFSFQMFYQLLVYNFENFKQIRFNPPLPVKDLLTISLDRTESGWTEEDGPKNVLVERALEILTEKSDIMKEYFSLRINKNGCLESLPMLIENHHPSLAYLPLYMLWLATEVEWDTEEECFETFIKETAKFYSIVAESDLDSKLHKWTVEHVIYPQLKKNLIPNKELKKCIFELTSLPILYKVFERC